jgi:exonuclease III
MNIISYNVRGMCKPKRRRLIKDILYNHQIDLVSLQKTKKESFKDNT